MSENPISWATSLFDIASNSIQNHPTGWFMVIVLLLLWRISYHIRRIADAQQARTRRKNLRGRRQSPFGSFGINTYMARRPTRQPFYGARVKMSDPGNTDTVASARRTQVGSHIGDLTNRNGGDTI